MSCIVVISQADSFVSKNLFPMTLGRKFSELITLLRLSSRTRTALLVPIFRDSSRFCYLVFCTLFTPFMVLTTAAINPVILIRHSQAQKRCRFPWCSNSKLLASFLNRSSQTKRLVTVTQAFFFISAAITSISKAV